MLKVKFKKLNEEAELPKYANHGDAGLDLKATSVEWSKDFHCYIYFFSFIYLVFPPSL